MKGSGNKKNPLKTTGCHCKVWSSTDREGQVVGLERK